MLRLILTLIRAAMAPLYAAPRWLWRAVWPFLNLLEVEWVVMLPWMLPVGLLGCWTAIRACLTELPANLRPLWADESLYTAAGAARNQMAALAQMKWHPSLEGPLLLGYRCILAAGTYTLGGFGLSFLWGGPLHVWSQGLSRRGRGSPADKTHGSACWETVQQAHAAGFLKDKGKPEGLLLGRVQGRVRGRVDGRYQSKGHILTCAPTGAGKGIGCVIPNLLQYPGSAFVLDLKGENYAVTAQRRLEMGHAVARLDPFGVSGKPSHAFNWLQAIDVNDEACISAAAQLAEALVVRNSTHDSHWDDSAQYLLQGFILYVAALGDEMRHMGTLREALTSSRTDLETLLRELSTSRIAFGRVGRMARTLLGKDERERASVMSTALRHTNFLDDPRIEKALRGHSFDFGSLKTGPMTVYLIIPPDKLTAYARFVRATLVLALQAMVAETTVPEHDVVFILDEVAQLGRIAPLEDAVSIMRGYGVRLWLLLQDLGQIQGTYRKWRSFLASSTLQFFGVQDNETARYVSEALGNQTVWVHGSGQSHNHGPKQGSRSSSSNRSATARPLLTAEEVRTLPATDVLVLSPGRKPHKLRRLHYVDDPETRDFAKPSPLYAARRHATTEG
jgi:type IV secretory pathway TraG/TraD family ATPase VirD4